MGEMMDFSYDVRAEFDAIKIRIGTRPRFARLEMGEPLVAAGGALSRDRKGRKKTGRDARGPVFFIVQ